MVYRSRGKRSQHAAALRRAKYVYDSWVLNIYLSREDNVIYEDGLLSLLLPYLGTNKERKLPRGSGEGRFAWWTVLLPVAACHFSFSGPFPTFSPIPLIPVLPIENVYPVSLPVPQGWAGGGSRACTTPAISLRMAPRPALSAAYLRFSWKAHFPPFCGQGWSGSWIRRCSCLDAEGSSAFGTVREAKEEGVVG